MSLVFDDLQITDEDINWVEGLFDEIEFDASRREIIKRLDPFDVQAFPGTGKTTVLVAKLAILARKWQWDDKGICVLSHTNVAREEIESKLANTEIGVRLLSHPHFIGTVHAFFDKYIATPRLKSDGYPITMVDTEITLTKRWHSLKQGTRNYLERKRKSESDLSAIKYPPQLGNIGCGEGTDSYRDAMRVLKASFDKGYFTFDEMLIVADQALKDSCWLPSSLQERFPIVLIDEAQDTSDFQWNLINTVFPKSGNSSIQLFGDGNQAIYNYSGQTEASKRFPEEPMLTIADSRRFGKSISILADPLSVSCKGINGINNMFDSLHDKNTIFVFDDISKVLPAFASFVLSIFSDEELLINQSIGVHAVGAVHNKGATDIHDKHFPVCVKDYWPLYDSALTRQSHGARQLIDYFRDGQLNKDSGHLEDCYANGIRKLLNITKIGFVPGNKSAVNALASVAIDERSFRAHLLDIIQMPFSSNEEWNLLVEQLAGMCKNCFGIEEVQHDFLTWKEGSNQEETIDRIGNIYHYEENGRSLDIEVGSIHSVKGRTHLATLVLDTYWYDRNIPSIIPWLSGNTKKIGSRDSVRLRTHYVALTRAKALVCIAIPSKAVVGISMDDLKTQGWNIKNI